MLVGIILELDIVGGSTDVTIRKDGETVAEGNWYLDEIQAHVTDMAKSFMWQDNDKVFIDLA